MGEVGNETIKTIITSPPYWNLKDYKTPGQIGFKEKYSDYLSRLNKVWEECYRVLKSEGSAWININYRVYHNKLYLIPFDILKNMQRINFVYTGAFIWHKPSGIPSSKRNFSQHFEYILSFIKDRSKFNFNAENLWKDDYGLLKTGHIGNSWRIVKKAGNIGKMPHPAIYPNELVERIINLTSKKEDVILDPFLGSGTTLLAAKKLDRSCIGYELNGAEYKKLIICRLNDTNLVGNEVKFF
ncbi:MAG: site-specific DNA-methyltransferase [Candidatus Parvarchaeota archaeon]|nr:site-specific DNA-methyltransferase [Candidatus Parvarchaeum tengchongense]MCW1298983.1 site-specific DNA-methyltransferase [Candidatus Parvarchaeum tengchongense]MCW1312067.1 site-specific DNA-methyltransferase [Candidatus Parvarchaeum tengchongense]